MSRALQSRQGSRASTERAGSSTETDRSATPTEPFRLDELAAKLPDADMDETTVLLAAAGQPDDVGCPGPVAGAAVPGQADQAAHAAPPEQRPTPTEKERPQTPRTPSDDEDEDAVFLPVMQPGPVSDPRRSPNRGSPRRSARQHQQSPQLPTIPETLVVAGSEAGGSAPVAAASLPARACSEINEDDYIFLPGAPFTLTMPAFRHGSIRLAKADLPVGNLTTIDDTLDWTAFQMAISGGAGDLFGETTDYSRPSEADQDERDDIAAWFMGFGFVTAGALVQVDDTPPIPFRSLARKRSSSPRSSGTDRGGARRNGSSGGCYKTGIAEGLASARNNVEKVKRSRSSRRGSGSQAIVSHGGSGGGSTGGGSSSSSSSSSNESSSRFMAGTTKPIPTVNTHFINQAGSRGSPPPGAPSHGLSPTSKLMQDIQNTDTGLALHSSFSASSASGLQRKRASQLARRNSKGRDAVVNHVGLAIDSSRRPSSLDSSGSSLPQSPMMDIVVNKDVNEHEYAVPMGFNLGHDLPDFLAWESENVAVTGFYGI